MPKLTGEKAKAVKNADTTNPFEAIPEGYYEYKLTKVESGKSKAGNAMWTWHFANVEHPKKKLREYTTLDDDALWKIATIFEAFGVDPSVSTDTLLGKTLILHIGVEIQEQGKGKGQKRNYIVGYPDQQAVEVGPFEVDDDEEEAPPKKAPARKKAATKKAADDNPDF